MSIKTNFASRGRNVLTIRVTSYEDHCLKGYISANQGEECQAFSSMVEMLLMVDDFMNAVNIPQRNEEQRRFASHNEHFSVQKEQLENVNDVPSAATFNMHVMFRQHATWQGNLIWEEAGQEACFRSVLELICLMHDALTAMEEQ